MSNNNCEVNAREIQRLDERVTALEEHREQDKKQLFELDKSLGIFIEEMKHISNDLKNVVTNFKEAVSRSSEAQERELGHLKEQVVEQGKKIEKLDAKLEKETVEKDANKWRDVTKYIITSVIGLILGLVAMYLGLK